MTCARPRYGVVSNSSDYPLSQIEDRASYVATTLQAQTSLQRLRWEAIEPNEGVQDWDVYDSIYAEFVEREIDVVWLVVGSPSWVNGTVGDPYIIPATNITPDPLPPLLNTNQTFEENLDGWTVLGGTMERSDEQAHEGTWSVKLTSDGTGDGGVSQVHSDEFEVEQSKDYRASGWIYSPDGYDSAGIAMNWFDNDGEYYKTTHANTSIPAAEWTFFEETFEAPWRAKTAVVFLRMGSNPSSGEIFYGDEIQVRRAPPKSSVNPINFQTYLENWRDFGRQLGERYPGSRWILWDRPNNPLYFKPERDASVFVLGYRHYSVWWIKFALHRLGYEISNWHKEVDTNMIARVAAYQADVGISPADGIMTSQTWNNLRQDYEEALDKSPIDHIAHDPDEHYGHFFGKKTGEFVSWIQRQLLEWGYWRGHTIHNPGYFDLTTHFSVKKFEWAKRIFVNGIVGDQTFGAMKKEWRKRNPDPPKKPKFENPAGGQIIDTSLSRQLYQTWYEHVRENIRIGDPLAEVSFATIEGMNVAPAPLETSGGINGAQFLTELYENASSPTTIENFAVFPLSPDSGTYNELIAEDDPFAWWRLDADPPVDSSGNGHDGTNNGATIDVPAPVGAEGLVEGYTFDGTSSHVATTTLGTFGSGMDSGFTIETWFEADVPEAIEDTGDPVPAPIPITKLSHISDDFEDGITNEDLWDNSNDIFIEHYGFTRIPQTGGRYRVMGSTRVVSFENDTVTWEWTFEKDSDPGDEQFIRILPGTFPSDGRIFFPNSITMGRFSENFGYEVDVNGNVFRDEFRSLDEEDFRWCRIRTDATQMHFEVSSDGQTWNDPFFDGSIPLPPFDLSQVTFAFENGFFRGNGCGDMYIHTVNPDPPTVPSGFGNALFGTVNTADDTALVFSLHRDVSNLPTTGTHRLLLQDADGTSRAFAFEAELTDGALHHLVLQHSPETNAPRVLVNGVDTPVHRTSGGTFSGPTDFDNAFVLGAANNQGTVEYRTPCTIYDFVVYDHLVEADRLEIHFEAVGRATTVDPPPPLTTTSGHNNFRDIARAREIVREHGRVDHMWVVFGWPDTLGEDLQAQYLTQAFEIIESNQFQSYRDVFKPPPIGGQIELRSLETLDVEYALWFRDQDVEPTDFVPPPTDPQTYEQVVLEDEPYLYYRMNETGGDDTLTDLSGNDHDAEYRNSPTRGTAAFSAELGTAVEFNGFNEWIDIHDSSFKEFGTLMRGGFTVECWVKTTTASNHDTIIGIFNDGSNTAFELSLNTEAGDENNEVNVHRMFVRDEWSQGSIFTFHSSTLRDGNWHHLVVASKPTRSHDKFVWIDGMRINVQGNNEINGPTRNFQYTTNIGAEQDRGNIADFFRGELDEFAIYTHVLSEGRVIAHFQAAQGLGETPEEEPPPEAFDDRMSGTYGLAKVDYPSITKTLKLAGDAFVRWIVSRFLRTPFLPPLVKPDPREGRFRIETRDRFTLEQVAVLPHVNIQAEFLLNRPGNLRFDMPLRHEKTTSDNIDPLRHEAWLYRDGQLVFVGPVWSTRANSGDSKLSVISRSLESYLETRLLGHGLPSDASFTEKPQERIAWLWIDYTQRKPFGNWCFVRGAHTGVSVNRTLVNKAHERTNILGAIEDISELSQGFDWEIDVNRRFNTWFPRITTEAITIEYGTNMSSYDMPLLGSTIANHVTVQGKDNDVETLEVIVEDFASQRAYGLMEYAEAMTEVELPEDTPLLEARAKYYLAENKQHRTMPQVVLRSHPNLGRVTELDNQRLRPGSTIRVRINDGYTQLDRTVRSTGYQLSVSANDSEAVTVYIDAEAGDSG